MSSEEQVSILIELIEEIKTQLDHECCQTLMDADSISTKIERTLKKINN
tara:strand:- start:183 stop:329 length:147 start_codon:yes stop_codon:yes gene_type:complete